MEANEVPQDAEKDKRRFIDEIFGRDFPLHSKHLVDNTSISTKIDENTREGKHFMPKKLEFKDVVMNLLQKKSFQGLFLRLQFWINQIIKSLFSRYRVTSPDLKLQIELNSL